MSVPYVISARLIDVYKRQVLDCGYGLKLLATKLPFWGGGAVVISKIKHYGHLNLFSVRAARYRGLFDARVDIEIKFVHCYREW